MGMIKSSARNYSNNKTVHISIHIQTTVNRTVIRLYVSALPVALFLDVGVLHEPPM